MALAARTDYLAYRRLVDFRVWFRGVPGTASVPHMITAWSVRRVQGRYAPHHYSEIVLAARRLAQSFRLNALAAESERGPYGEKKFLALQLTTGRDPMVSPAGSPSWRPASQNRLICRGHEPRVWSRR